MRMSCNGCRVLRKGCSENCTIRPCLEWIKTSDSQSKATLFLAKFYGRAGLMNLINSGAPHLRPGIFRSLLYEACGRIVNPVYGSVGLVSSGNWHLCQSAVEAVLNGAPISQMTADIENGPSLNAYGIRHVSKPDNSSGSNDLNQVRSRSRCRFKRPGSKAKRSRLCVGSDEETNRSPSHESSLSHQSEAAEPIMVSGSPESVSVAFAETVDPDDRSRLETDLHLARYDEGQAGDGEVELELTLRL